MGIQVDLIIPPVIVGLLVLVIFQVNSFIMETSVDTRLTNDMQTFADVNTRVIQEEIKSAQQIITPANANVADSVLTFVDATGETVVVQKAGRALEIIRTNPVTATSDTTVYPAMLSSIYFDLEPNNIPTPYFLEVKIGTESLPQQHASPDDNFDTAKAFAENRIYLRNVHMNSLGPSSP